MSASVPAVPGPVPLTPARGTGSSRHAEERTTVAIGITPDSARLFEWLFACTLAHPTGGGPLAPGPTPGSGGFGVIPGPPGALTPERSHRRVATNVALTQVLGAALTMRQGIKRAVIAAGIEGTTPSARLLANDAALRIFDMDGGGPYTSAEFQRAYDTNAHFDLITRP